MWTMKQRQLGWLAGMLVAASAMGCSSDSGDDGGDDGGPAEQDVTLAFSAMVGDVPFACDQTYSGVGADGAGTFEPLDLRMYVHSVAVRSGGAWVDVALTPDGKWQSADVALLDFEDKTGTCENGTTDTNFTVVGKASFDPSVGYDAVRFVVGVPPADNHQDASVADPPLNLTGMFWNWANGYKFFRFELRMANGATFKYHLGSVGCTAGDDGTTCTTPNQATYELDVANADAPIELDIKALLAGLDLDDSDGEQTGDCMSMPAHDACAVIFGHVGLDGSEQTIFSTGG
jgi:uncharacterized repeat protein (TIGR04052 family)